MPKSYQPGNRNPRYGQNHKVSEDRYAWVHGLIGKFMILVGEDKGSGPDVVIHMPRPGKIPDHALNLSSMTMPELEALRDLFATAFEWAETVVRLRDKEAEDAWNAGDDSHARNYRPLPTVVYRKRPEFQYREGVYVGFEGVPEGGRGERPDHLRGIRGARPELAEPNEDADGTQDSGATPDQSEKLRQMGEVGTDLDGLHRADSEQDDSASDN